MKRMKIYLIAALYCMVVSCSTSKKVDLDDDFATDPTDEVAAFSTDDPGQATADLSEFDLDEMATDSDLTAPVAEPSSSASAGQDEFADFDSPAVTTDTAQAAPAEVDEFADFDNSATSADTAQAAPAQIDEFANLENSGNDQAAVPPSDLNLDLDAPLTPAPLDAPPVVAEQAPPPEMDSPVPVEASGESQLESELSAMAAPEPPKDLLLTKIENISYKPNQNGGAITIEGNQPLQFTTRHNTSTNQLVVEVQDAIIPDKLKRSLNTKDMASSIGSVDIYQKANSKVARFVVQLRPGSDEPLVQPEGNSLLIIGAANEAFVAKQRADAARESFVQKEKESRDGFVDLNSEGILGTDSLEEFLVGNQKFFGKKISIETNNLDVKEAIKFIAEESGANLLMDDGLEGKISLRLRQVPWDQALILILKANKLGYVRQGNVLRIAKLENLQKEEDEAYRLLEVRRSNEPLIVKRFFISYAILEEIQKKIRDFMIATAPVTSANPIGTAQGVGAAAAATISGTSASAAASPGQSSLQERMALGRVIADERTSSLIVTDTKENMTKIEKLIAALDTQPKQIVLETRIVNATETFSKSIGFNWASSGSTNPSQNSATIGLTTQSSLPESAIVNTTFSWKNLDVIGNLDAIIALGEIQDKVKVLNTQRMTVSSNKTADIGAESKLRIPIRTTSSVGGTSGATTNTSGFETITYGLKGKITPQATTENTIFADVDLQQIAITNRETGDTTNNQLGGRVLAQSGQTVAVNASFQSRNSSTDSGVPGLRDVPILGMLFKGKSEDMFKAETLVFITMTILEPVTGIFKKAAGEINSDPTQEVQ